MIYRLTPNIATIFISLGFFLTDVNECAGENVCDANAMCNNTDGSYTCQCVEGYSGNGTHCEGKHMYKYIA